MPLDAAVCYRALQTRDARFDGRFFTAVRSTGVYCRPICPAPTPRRENCLFVPCAAAAQEAGFRPCLRCRPEASPGTPAWLGTSATVSRALRLISEGALDSGSVDQLAGRLGIGERHLRRLFLEHLGAPPLAVAQNRRILFAKKLIDETALRMSDVALASGFSSIRRFNDAIRATYSRTPRALRAAGARGTPPATGSDITLKLPFRPPYPWKSLVDFLTPRVTPGVESVDVTGYRRTISIDGCRGLVEVSPVPKANHLLARIRLSNPLVLIAVAERLRRLFDLGADPAVISAQLRRDRHLAAAVRRRPGIRIPGSWSGFELAVRAILGQQVSVAAATRLAGRLVACYGEPLKGIGAGEDDALRFAFPEPEALTRADPKKLGMPAARATAIAALARAVSRGEIVLDASRGLDESVAALRALPGIGEWTAQYIAMRALREPDAFPATDLGLRRALDDGSGPLSDARLLELAEAWRPWRAYAAMYLWAHPSGSQRAASV